MQYFFQIFLILFLFTSCSSSKLSAQTSVSKKAKEMYLKADEAYVMGRTEEAFVGFQEVLEMEPDFLEAHQRIAEIYFNLAEDYDKAVIHFERIIDLDSSSLRAYYNAATCYFYLQDFKQAKVYADKYLKEGDLSETGKWKANLLVESIAFAPNAIANKVAYNPQNLGEKVNSAKSEYFPSITADNEWLYFTVNDESERYPNEDIYAAQFLDGEWKEREGVASVNSPDSQEGAHSITQDGRYLFFASGRKGNIGKFDIYIAKKVGNKWNPPVNLGTPLNSHHWESQPVITADSKAVFFVRNSKDGFGGGDIYVSYIGSNGKFGEPKNLGDVINTPGDEQRPYLHPDGKTLYFASNGHPGMGKSDLFKSTLQEDGSWSKPENLGYPINSNEVEFGIYVASDGKSAYISSDREGGFGGMDIYSFELPRSAKPERVVSVKGIVLDDNTNGALSANIKIIDVESGEVYKTLSTDKINGSFLITLPAGKNYLFQANADSYLPYSENFSLVNAPSNSLFELEAKMQKVAKGQEFVLRNIFFDTGKYALKDASKTELDLLIKYMNENKLLYLEVGGHTDNDGSENENLVLSEKRAKAVYDYLIANGIHITRVKFKGYGESRPIYENSSEENKAKNRRTAFRVL